MKLTFEQSRNLYDILDCFQTESKFWYGFEIRNGKCFITAESPIGSKRVYKISLNKSRTGQQIKSLKNKMIDDAALFLDPEANINGDHHYYRTDLTYKGTKLKLSMETFLESAICTDLLPAWDYILSKGYIVTDCDPYKTIQFVTIESGPVYKLDFKWGIELFSDESKKSLGRFKNVSEAIDSLGAFLPGFN